jgi:hypothetical protein
MRLGGRRAEGKVFVEEEEIRGVFLLVERLQLATIARIPSLRRQRARSFT